MQYHDCCQAAGDCITPNDCAMCAKKVVALLQSYESQLQRERQRLLEEEQRQQREQERREEAERERIRQEKRAAKVGGHKLARPGIISISCSGEEAGGGQDEGGRGQERGGHEAKPRDAGEIFVQLTLILRGYYH